MVSRACLTFQVTNQILILTFVLEAGVVVPWAWFLPVPAQDREEAGLQMFYNLVDTLPCQARC